MRTTFVLLLLILSGIFLYGQNNTAIVLVAIVITLTLLVAFVRGFIEYILNRRLLVACLLFVLRALYRVL